MQEVEMLHHTKMWPKGLSGNNGYRLFGFTENSMSVLPFLLQSGLSADLRREPAAWYPNGLFS